MGAQCQRHAPPLQDGALDLLHAINLALLVARLLDMTLIHDDAGPELEARNRLLQPRDLLLLRGEALLLALQRQLARDGIGRVSARPERDGAFLQFGDLR